MLQVEDVLSNPALKHKEDRESDVSLAHNITHNHELFRLHASRFVDLFPNELVIKEKTVSVIDNQFLFSSIETMPVRDIGRVVYVNTPVFGGLRIIGKNTQHQLSIKGLNKKQAMAAKEIIDGLILEDTGVIDVPYWNEADNRRDELAEAAGRDPRNFRILKSLVEQ